MSATYGVLHGPRAAQMYGIGSCIVTIALGYRNDVIAVIAAAMAVVASEACLPTAAAVCVAVCAGATCIKASRVTKILACCVFALTGGVLRPHLTARFAQLIAFVLTIVMATIRRTRIRVIQHTIIAAVGVALCVGYAVLPEAGRAIRRLRGGLPQGYTLLAHAKDATGRVSVLEEQARQVRFLISDHSILGGRYTAQEFERETIFAQFHVHEAVRLTEGPGDRALCLGLGIGVVAQALHEHGVAVTAVEIDASVARFAQRYFGVRGPNIVVRDATRYLDEAKRNQFDYVVHDVFTGGAVPLPMFSVKTFAAIRDVMHEDGVLALNFVGAINETQSAAVRAVAAVWGRLRSVFQHVDAYTEDYSSLVHNVVFFASDKRQRLRFRKPLPQDFLGSSIREDTLLSFEDHRLEYGALPRVAPQDATDRVINAGQWITASEHWKSMRKILHGSVWYALAAADAIEK